MNVFTAIKKHCGIIGALILREMSTRFGREGLGFTWLVLEPLAFCIGVILLWSLTKPAFEHGIRVAAFTMTGYMCVILFRHQIQYSLAALQSNIGLLHHRQISPVHIFLSRNIMEFGGATIAFIVVYAALLALGQIDLPKDYLTAYLGWMLLGWIGMGLGLTMAGLAMRFDVLERVVNLITYILIPLSGAFSMVAWVPPDIREIYLLMPLPHAVEMLRAGVFGEFVKTYYDPYYGLAWGAGLNILGLLLIASSRDQIDVE